MWGVLFGDVIGSVYEWHNIKARAFPLFERGSRFTDDSVLTAAVADKLLYDAGRPAFGGTSARAKLYAARYVQYYRRYPGAGFGQMFAAWAEEGGTARGRSYGNGAAMRAAPVGYAMGTLEDVLREARISALPTHGHREAVRAAQAVAGCVFLARTGESKEAIGRFAARQMGVKLDFTLDAIRDAYVFDSRAGYSVPPAVAAFLESEDYESAIRGAISIGGDSDTIAAVAGGIAEAYYRAIPRHIADRATSLLDSGIRQTARAFCARFNVATKWV